MSSEIAHQHLMHRAHRCAEQPAYNVERGEGHLNLPTAIVEFVDDILSVKRLEMLEREVRNIEAYYGLYCSGPPFQKKTNEC